ncbi:hypothetical protein ACUN0C_11430 [Faunimonas sp. B44]|uniref:hypothetical protein n=1 Tax=Faunimonas sp. B44 TaxID=3461493 RepID=UPI0040447B00
MRRRGHAPIPTVDIYVRYAVGDLIRDWPWQRGRPVVPAGRTGFRCGDALVIVRYADPATLRSARSAREVFYLLDDDLWALDADAGLPEYYRRRLARFRDEVLPGILDVATAIVTPSQAILDRLKPIPGALLAPCLPAPRLAPPRGGLSEPARIVIPATGSHAEDVGMIAASIRSVVARRPDVVVTTFLGDRAPAELAGLPNVRNERQSAWPGYRRRLAEDCYDIALAPARDTAFNRARSTSKILDVAQLRAAGLYSAREPYAGVIRHGEDGLLLPDDPDAWAEAILSLVEDRARARDLALAGQETALRIGDPARVRTFWMERLGPVRPA